MFLRVLIFFFLTIVFVISAKGQDSTIHVLPLLAGGIYSQNPSGSTNEPAYIADVAITGKTLYSEIRYNFDQQNTLGLYSGTQFKLSNSSIIIPAVGVLYGLYKGISFQLNYQGVFPWIEFNLQNQYSISLNQKAAFYSTWSDIQLPLTKEFKMGVSYQCTLENTQNSIDIGTVFTYRAPQFSCLLYAFDIYALKKSFFFLGITKDIELRKRKA